MVQAPSGGRATTEEGRRRRRPWIERAERETIPGSRGREGATGMVPGPPAPPAGTAPPAWVPGASSQDQGGIVMNAYWPAPVGLHTASGSLPVEGELPSFGGATGWLNSPPLTAADLRGKVVLVSFWTYTCINWLRQLPYLRAWAQKYSGHGLVVVGVHTPEFSFEHNADNVRQAVQDMQIAYPVAADNDYAVWSAFGNHYWPALYFADGEEHIRHH